MNQQKEEKTKLTDEELLQLRSINNKHRQLTVEFGTIERLRLDLDQRRLQAEKALKELIDSDQSLAFNLEQKYGKVNINLETGELTLLT